MCVPLTRVFRLQSPDTIFWRGWPLKVDGTQIKHRKLARAASITPPCVNRAANSHQVTKYQRVLPTLRQQYSKDLPSARIWLPAFRDSRSSSPDPFIFEQPCLIYAFNGQDRWPDVLSRLQRPPKPHFCLATLCIPLSTRISWLYSRQHSALFRPVSPQRSSALRGDIAEPCAAQNDSPRLYPGFSRFDAASCCICLHCTRSKE